MSFSLFYLNTPLWYERFILNLLNMCFFHSQSNVISIFSQWSNELIYIFMHLFNQKLLEVGLGLFHRDLARGKIIRRVKKPHSEQLGFCIGIIRWPPMARLMGSCHTELKAEDSLKRSKRMTKGAHMEKEVCESEDYKQNKRRRRVWISAQPMEAAFSLSHFEEPSTVKGSRWSLYK